MPQLAHAQTGKQITLKRILDGAKGQLVTDSATTVSDTAYFSEALRNKLDTPYQVRNIITFSINEYSRLVLPDSFRATVNLRIYYTLANLSVDSVDQSLSINYDTAGTYTMRSSFVFNGAHQVKVRILSVTSAASVDILPALMVMNEMEVHPLYKVYCTADAVKDLSHNAAKADTTGELEVSWSVTTGADVYDLEWAYVDESALSMGRYGNPANPNSALIFENNTTRVTTSVNSYSIPLLYNEKGTLFYRIRGVQERTGYQRIETNWSSDASGGLGVYQYAGHEPLLNWQSTIYFAEEGKRKVKVNYYDGSLRKRQAITKDNSTNTVIAQEVFYDYQGRPTIQVLPAPTLSGILKYAHDLNIGLNGAEYDKNSYDSLGTQEEYLTASAEPMSNTSGANQYYSPNNPDKGKGINQYIPDANGYAYTQTEYTADNTNRVLRQSLPGETFKLGSGHEQQYSYNTATKRELYSLFGTEVGDNTHYFKDAVTDENGQTSVKYMDTHGHIIATALAGSPENMSMEDLPSKETVTVTDSLSGADKNTISGTRISSRHSQLVTESDTFRFTYQLIPPVLQKKDCNGKLLCYTGLYDLEIRITDDAYNQRFADKKPFQKILKAKLDSINVDCNQPSKPIEVSFDVYLKKGSYDFTKTLTINQAAMDYYRDSIFLKKSICTSYDKILEEQKARLRTIQCVPDCAGCLADIGDWESYRRSYMNDNGYAIADTANYRGEALASYNAAVASCNLLCGNGTETDAIRDAMLLDMAAPSGQYAIPSDTANAYSIFYLNFKDTTYTYMDTSLHYLDEAGRLDKVYDASINQYVLPQQLRPAEFAAAFKNSWSAALLHLHPEYCKLVEKNKYRSSEVWNTSFEAVDTYAEAKAKGYLNPTNISGISVPFTATNTDPFVLNTTFKTQLETQMKNCNKSGYNIWSVAMSSVKCASIDKNCPELYKNAADAFNESKMCEGDLNMAWRSFRNMYLTTKRSVMDDYLKNINCGAKVSDLLTAGKQLRFTSSNDQLANAGLGGLTGAQTEKEMKAYADTEEKKMYAENCSTYVSYWVQQLSGCYDTTEIKTNIIPKLLEVCKAGADPDHPMGASSVKPGSTYQYRSFEEVIDEYNRIRGRNKDMACNADVITMPKPYDRQVSYGDQPTFTPPTSCQCEKVTELKREYTAMKRPLETFASYIRRKRGVTISQSDLDILESACNASNNNSTCSWLPQQLTLPSIFQCNVAPACATCDEVTKLYTSFKTTYGITPVIIEEDSVQDKKNEFFAAYMNNRLGFGKQAWEYLAFINDSCKQTAGNGVTVCKPGAGKGNPQVSTYSNGSADEINDILRSRDSGYVLAGWTRGCSAGQEDAYLIKTDRTGAVKWSKTYGAENHEEIKRIRQTSDGGYIAIGSTNSYCYDNGVILVMRLDSIGGVIWNKALDLGTAGYTGKGTDVIETSEGEYAFAGQGLPSKWVTGVLTADGTLKWTKILSSGDRKEQMSLVENGDTLVAGTAIAIGTANYDAVVLKFNKADGSLLEMSGYKGEANSDHIPGTILKTPAGYKLVGVNSATLVDVAGNGEITSARKVTAPGSIIAGSVTGAGMSDGSLLLSQSVAGSTGGAYWHKVGSNNGVLWSSHVRVNGQEYLRHVTETQDGTLAGGGVMDGKAMLMIATAAGKTGCKDTSEVVNSTDILSSVIRKTIPTQTITDLNPNFISAVALNEKACNPVRSITSCPGVDSCYMVNDLPLMCGNLGVFPNEPIEQTTACSDSTFFAESAAAVLYKVYTDSVKNDFDAAYMRTALKAATQEKFAVRYSTSEYYYTLYYYDQAGNLVKTIPPAGVVKIQRDTWIDSVDVAKAAGRKLVPPHTMASEYRYNSFNKVVSQKTPDMGITSYWYDKLGRLVVSQNAKQRGTNAYNYNIYDGIGRETEIGELTSATVMTQAISQQQTSFTNWLNNVASSKKQILRTTYDNAYPFFNPGEFNGRNLRNRISWTALYKNADSINTGGHSVASFYTYDIHGNIDTLLQDYKEGKMASAGHRFKKMSYSYDLVSGNVHLMAYQSGAPDAFYHRFTHDADNRITNVETSHDGVYWENDAYYQYYKHSRKARTVIGQQQVQGIDYAYTLQGWIKGVNSTSLTPEADQGEDGKSGSIIPKDAFGISLHYFLNDYISINAKKPFAGVTNGFKALYNGNVGAMSQHLAGIGNPLMYNYNYDALNRIKGMQASGDLNVATNTWNGSVLEDFKESVSYDGNGNIITYNRNGNSSFQGKPLGMDSLTYIYRPGTNKLDHVKDAVGDINYDDDIDNQIAGNYAYDSIGNMVKDIAAGIKEITWNTFGKISSIIGTNNDTINYTYDVLGNRISKQVHDTVTWYVRDAKGNVKSTYVLSGEKNVTLSETLLYGEGRLGIVYQNQSLNNGAENQVLMKDLRFGKTINFIRGRKSFELTNHLSNVLATVSDKKYLELIGDTLRYRFDLISANEYYPFGMLMPGRTYSARTYRYGFNGKENDNEIKGQGNQQDYGLRIYDPRLGKFLSVDPLYQKFAYYSPYQFAGNKPIWAVDVDGGEEKKQTSDNMTANDYRTFYGKIDNLFNSITKLYEAEQFGLTGDQTVRLVSTVNEKKDIIVKAGDPTKPPIIIYKIGDGNTWYGNNVDASFYRPEIEFTDIIFYGNSDKIYDGKKGFQNILKMLKEFPNATVSINGRSNLPKDFVIGNTIKGVSAPTSTEALVNARRDAIIKELVETYGVDPSRITTSVVQYDQKSKTNADGTKTMATSTTVVIMTNDDKPAEYIKAEKEVREQNVTGSQNANRSNQ